jgi:demethylmenaquinone methyltransferase/2-methoxy-6-polyprenyl-1,4-benzoquinol methylase
MLILPPKKESKFGSKEPENRLKPNPLAASKIRDMFNQISPTYDRVNRVLSFGRDFAWRKAVARHLPTRPHLQVLDLATGTGDQLIAFFQAGASIHFGVGIDIAEEMLKIGREKTRAYPVELTLGDAQKIPFGESRFDAVSISFGIRNVSDPSLALREMHRVLKPLGRCLILEFSMPPKWIRPFFLFYLRHVLPRLGGWLSQQTEAYLYLNQTIEAFPSGEPFLALMRNAGFTKSKRVSMNAGSVSLYVGEKSE